MKNDSPWKLKAGAKIETLYTTSKMADSTGTRGPRDKALDKDSRRQTNELWREMALFKCQSFQLPYQGLIEKT